MIDITSPESLHRCKMMVRVDTKRVLSIIESRIEGRETSKFDIINTDTHLQVSLKCFVVGGVMSQLKIDGRRGNKFDQ